MITVIVPTLNDERTLPRAFESLIGAVVGGVVREVIVADGGSTDATQAIAESAGAHIVEAGPSRAARCAAGAAAARNDWLLFAYPTVAFEQGWESHVESFLSRATLERPLAASFRLSIDAFGANARREELLASVRCAVFGLPYGEQGLLLPKRLYQRLGGHRDVPMDDIDLVRRIGRRRLAMLRARAVCKPAERLRETRRVALTALHALRVPKRMVALLGG